MQSIDWVLIAFIASFTIQSSIHMICRACIRVKEQNVTEALEKEKLWQASRSNASR